MNFELTSDCSNLPAPNSLSFMLSDTGNTAQSNYFLSCVRPADVSKWGHILTTIHLKYIAPFSGIGQLHFRYFCGEKTFIINPFCVKDTESIISISGGYSAEHCKIEVVEEFLLPTAFKRCNF